MTTLIASRGPSTYTSRKRRNNHTDADRAAKRARVDTTVDTTSRAPTRGPSKYQQLWPDKVIPADFMGNAPIQRRAPSENTSDPQEREAKKRPRSESLDEPQLPLAKKARVAAAAPNSKPAMKKRPRSDSDDPPQQPPTKKRAPTQPLAPRGAQPVTSASASTLQPPTKKTGSTQPLAKHIARRVVRSPTNLVCDLCDFEAKSQTGLSQHRGKAKCRDRAAKLAKKQATLPKSSTPATVDDSSSDNKPSSPTGVESPPKKKKRSTNSPPSGTDLPKVQSGTQPTGLLNHRSASAGNAAIHMLAASLTDKDIDMLCASGGTELPLFGMTEKELIQYDHGELQGTEKTSFEQKLNEAKEDLMATAMTWGATDNVVRCDPSQPKKPAVKIAPYLGQVLKKIRKAEKDGAEIHVTSLMMQVVFAYSGQKYLPAMDGIDTNLKTALERRQHLDRVENEAKDDAANYLQNLLKAVVKECPNVADRFQLKMATFGTCNNGDCDGKTQELNTMLALQVKVPEPETEVVVGHIEKDPTMIKKSRVEMTLGSDGTEQTERISLEPEKDADGDNEDGEVDENPLADLMALDPEEVPIEHTTKSLIEANLNYESIAELSCNECNTPSSIQEKKAVTVYPAYLLVPIARSKNEAKLEISRLDSINIGEEKYRMTAMVQQDTKTGFNVASRIVKGKWWRLSDERVARVHTAHLQDGYGKQCVFVLLKKN